MGSEMCIRDSIYTDTDILSNILLQENKEVLWRYDSRSTILSNALVNLINSDPDTGLAELVSTFFINCIFVQGTDLDRLLALRDKTRNITEGKMHMFVPSLQHMSTNTPVFSPGSILTDNFGNIEDTLKYIRNFLS